MPDIRTLGGHGYANDIQQYSDFVGKCTGPCAASRHVSHRRLGVTGTEAEGPLRQKDV